MEKRKQPERAEQAAVVKLLRLLGAHVYTLGTVRRHGDHPGTMMSPGLPDVIAFLPVVEHVTGATARRLLFVEVKADGGRLSPAQRAFGYACAQAGVEYLVGPVSVVAEWLDAHGYVRTRA